MEAGKDEEGREDDEEPKLKYQRLGFSVVEILQADSARCLAAHTRFLVLGTSAGLVIVLDFNGNEVRRFTPHSGPVSDISIDAAGEFCGSCSEDGTVAIHSLYDAAESATFWYQQPVKAISLDPEYAAGRRAFACGGTGGQLVLVSRGWFGTREEVLHAGEGPVRAMRWQGSYLAWANDLGVKVYDTQSQQRISFIDRPANSPGPEAFTPCLVWEGPTRLIIGWADLIKVGVVRYRQPATTAGGGAVSLPATVTGSQQAARYIEIVAMIRTDGYICGIAPLPPVVASIVLGKTAGGQPEDLPLVLAVLVYSCEAADEAAFAAGVSVDGRAERPELRLLTTDNEELSSDALSLHQYALHRAKAYSVAHLPVPVPRAEHTSPDERGAARRLFGRGDEARGARALLSSLGAMAPLGGLQLPAMRSDVSPQQACPASEDADSIADRSSPGAGENTPAKVLPPQEPVLYVVSPFDIVVVRSRDTHDRLAWLVERSLFEEALRVARDAGPAVRESERTKVGELFLGHLIETKRADEAADQLPAILGSDSALWSKWLLAFARAGALEPAANNLPTRPPHLDASVYDLVLLHVMRTVCRLPTVAAHPCAAEGGGLGGGHLTAGCPGPPPCRARIPRCFDGSSGHGRKGPTRRQMWSRLHS